MKFLNYLGFYNKIINVNDILLYLNASSKIGSRLSTGGYLRSRYNTYV